MQHPDFNTFTRTPVGAGAFFNQPQCKEKGLKTLASVPNGYYEQEKFYDYTPSNTVRRRLNFVFGNWLVPYRACFCAQLAGPYPGITIENDVNSITYAMLEQFNFHPVFTRHIMSIFDEAQRPETLREHAMRIFSLIPLGIDTRSVANAIEADKSNATSYRKYCRALVAHAPPHLTKVVTKGLVPA